MLKTRVIPIVTWNGVVAVQTVQFKNPRSIGSLQQALSVYERRCCDELVVLDIAATPEQRSPNLAAVADIADGVFCPLAVGGGISHSLQCRDIIKNGADKIVLGRWASPELIYACAQKMGNQSVVVALDAQPSNGLDFLWQRWAVMMENAGAGEILLTSTDRQGTKRGYDLELIASISKAVSIPVVCNGGCGRPEHMVEAIRAGAHAAAAGTMFAFTQWTPKDCAKVLNEAGIPARVD
jgi:imidazole glycerol-phosphate synthase subunit HisF